jgi:hypothetical protein
MSNDPYSQSVLINESKLINEEEQEQRQQPYSTTSMKTIVGTVQVADKSYDVQGNPVNSKQDTPIDVNALHGVQPVHSQFQVPSTGKDIQLETSDSKISDSTTTTPRNTNENPEQTFLPH